MTAQVMSSVLYEGKHFNLVNGNPFIPGDYGFEYSPTSSACTGLYCHYTIHDNRLHLIDAMIGLPYDPSDPFRQNEDLERQRQLTLHGHKPEIDGLERHFRNINMPLTFSGIIRIEAPSPYPYDDVRALARCPGFLLRFEEGILIKAEPTDCDPDPMYPSEFEDPIPPL
ncbi:hypothetical protein QKW35_14470 [Pontibacterium granulatum]|uniref:hypothetical protein n=1 Tax=Pontibacterium granulatum TaxID=2036029 RepID=UPI00249A5622|nr:hypothetical protein [Pontibacterium granulatum]MDI3325580.1 hypothetical protein [Pontibacterium granulatum]